MWSIGLVPCTVQGWLCIAAGSTVPPRGRCFTNSYLCALSSVKPASPLRGVFLPSNRLASRSQVHTQHPPH